MNSRRRMALIGILASTGLFILGVVLGSTTENFTWTVALWIPGGLLFIISLIGAAVSDIEHIGKEPS